MTTIDTPHFNFPFAIAGGSVAVVEQDTLDDIVNCVEVALLTRVGYRPEAPGFGTPDFAFLKQPIGRDFILQILQAQEPRAALAIQESPDVFDELIDRVLVEIGAKEGSSQ